MAFSIEMGKVMFTLTDSAVYTYTQSYNREPSIVCIVSGSDNVNAFAELVTLTQATIRTSAPCNAAVTVHVMSHNAP